MGLCRKLSDSVLDDEKRQTLALEYSNKYTFLGTGIFIINKKAQLF